MMSAASKLTLAGPLRCLLVCCVAGTDENNTLWDGRVGAWQSMWSSMLQGDFVLTSPDTAVTGPFGGVDWRGTLFSHVAPPETIDTITSLGINAFACSNNHVCVRHHSCDAWR